MATTTFDNLITFSRGSNATVTGPNGLIQWAPSNQLLNSQDLEATYWVKLNATITANTSVAPDGSITAETLTSTSSVSATTGVYRGISFTSGHTASVYVKAGTSNIAWVSSNTGESYAVFNLATGAVIEAGNATASILAVGNGWYRIAAANTTVAGTFFIVGGKDAYTTGHPWANGTWTSGNTILVWGAQLELGSTATTYNNTSVRNLLGFSEAFDNAAWTKSASSIVPGAQANPVNGLFNAQKLMENTATNVHRVQQGFATTTGVTYTFSCYAKAAERSWIYLYDDAANGFAFFDLANGVKGTIAAGWTSTSITPVGNGWYRISGTATEASGGAGNQLIGIASANNVSNYTGDGNSGVYIYGAQLSNSASLDPYVPTPGAAPSSTAYYGPRFDYDPVTLQPRGLLVEEARTNLLLQSEDWASATWTKTGSTIAANSTTAPSGAATADTLIPNNGTALASADTSQDISKAASATTYTLSLFVKTAGYDRVYFRCQDSGGAVNRADVTFNISNGTISTAAAVAGTFTSPSATITPFGNGWYRATLTFTSSADTLLRTRLYALDSVAVNGNGTSGIFLYGAQLEAGAFATSYIPTIASTVTRSADVATITGSLFSQWYNQQTGSFIAEWAINNANSTGRYIVKAFSPSVAQGYGLWLNSNSIDTRAWIGATSITAGNAALSTANKAAFGYRAGDNAASVNGIAAVASSATGPTDATYLEIGSAGASYFNGWLRSIRYVPVRAADFQLQQVTT